MAHKTTSLQGFINSGFAVIDEGQVNNLDVTVVIILAFMWLWYRQSAACKVFYTGHLLKSTFSKKYFTLPLGG